MTDTPVPRPRSAVRGSASGRPMMAALDLLGRRWTLRVVWELRQRQPAGFRDLRRRCDDMSSSVLSTRLDELEQTGLVELDAEGRYRLTPIGQQLDSALVPLLEWSRRWAATFDA